MSTLYHRYREVFAGHPKPFAYIDLDLFDQNVSAILGRAGKMPICVASKSVRCVAILRRIQQASPQFHSLMAYSAREAVYLSQNGFDNILVAYPVWGEAAHAGVCEEIRDGKRITLMVDSADHIEHIEKIGAAADTIISICIDLDMSTTYPGLHFGVRRSNVTTAAHALALWEKARKWRHVSLDGVMGYEAQIAGLQDNVPGNSTKAKLIRFLKKRSIKEVARRRAEVVHALKYAGCELKFVNGGGTGSVETTILENPVTEVTVGSGFYAPALFDHYVNFKHAPAAGFAIEITRQPLPHVYTCHGGGYIASGPAGADRLPRPYLPDGAKLLPLEGAGEVQTPVEYHGPEKLELGDPIFLRHSKAGELCEQFKTLVLISDGKIVDEVNTYRGDGQCFV